MPRGQMKFSDRSCFWPFGGNCFVDYGAAQNLSSGDLFDPQPIKIIIYTLR